MKMLIRFCFSKLLIFFYLIPTIASAQDDGLYVGFSPGLSLGSAQWSGLSASPDGFEKRVGSSFEMYSELKSSDYYVHIGIQYTNFGYKTSEPLILGNTLIDGKANWNYDYIMIPVTAGGTLHYSDEFNLFIGAGLSPGYLIKEEFLVDDVSIPGGAPQDTSGIKKWNIFGVFDVGINVTINESIQLQCRASGNLGLANIYGEGFSTRNIGNTVISIGIRSRLFGLY